LIDCCWGEWGQPESKSIINHLDEKKEIVLLTKEQIFNNQCNFKKGFYYFDPHDIGLINYFDNCNLGKKVFVFEKNDIKIFGRLRID